MCGGTVCLKRGKDVRPGLSPRVRGNPAEGLVGLGKARSIPACAGEPPGGDWTTQMLVSVYPRVCGGTKNRECRA